LPARHHPIHTSTWANTRRLGPISSATAYCSILALSQSWLLRRYANVSSNEKCDVICLSYHSWLDLAAGLFSRKNLARWLVSQLEYGEGSGNAAKEDQREADELENAHMRAIARRLERNTHYEEEGGPQWDCP
jgi:hypothetical protein